MERTIVPIIKLMEKEDAVHVRNGTLFSQKKEHNCYHLQQHG